MSVEKTIQSRRAYRSLKTVDITRGMVDDLSCNAGLAPSCFNNQPWRYVFVSDPDVLNSLKEALSKGNAWATAASMIIAVCTRRDLDCIVKSREYDRFDTGMATAFLILRATEMGLVAHPIAGFDAEKAKKVLKIPGDMSLITLVIVGARAETPGPLLSEKQILIEEKRPERLSTDAFAFIDHYDMNQHVSPEE